MAKRKGLDLDFIQKRVTGEKAEPETNETTYKESPNYVARRMEVQKSLATGKREKRLTYRIDPKICKIRDNHDRNYSNLNEDNCRELIEGIKMHGQETPAIVRLLEGSDDYRYELVCGARRHWVTSYLKLDFIVEVRDLSEEEVFLISDEENRNRQDITDYERAIKYKLALRDLYKNQIQMSERMGVTQDWLSRYLSLGLMDSNIVKAYSDLAEIKVRHARELRLLMKDPVQAKRVIDAAIAMHSSPEKGQIVIARLKNAAKTKSKTPMLTTKHYTGSNKKKFCRATLCSQKKLVIEIDQTTGADLEDWISAIKSVYQDHH